ncbi:MAG: polyprenyl synthetase family protein, partial [Gammaproteobacteria bacterium]
MTYPFLSAVQDDFGLVDDLIRKNLNSNVPLVEEIASYLIEAGGKRLRPLLVLLSARAAGYQGEDHIKLAAIIEFLHTAMLLHDDVVDESDLRRGRKTVNSAWGNAPSVLVGDFLHSRAFEMMVEIGNLRVMQILSRATNLISEGEVQQLANLRNPSITEDEYFEIINRKTAMLFQA